MMMEANRRVTQSGLERMLPGEVRELEAMLALECVVDAEEPYYAALYSLGEVDA